jgi:hypothetical protein
MTAVGQEERFPPTTLSAGYGFRKETIAGVRRNGRDTPFADLPTLTPERGGSLLRTFLAHSVDGWADRERTFAPDFGICQSPAQASSSSSAFAPLRSGVSKPSVNQP